MIELTDWAREILSKSSAAARRFNPDAKVRLVRTNDGAEALLTDEPGPNDEVVELPDGGELFVQAGIEGLVDVEEPHDRIVLRPAGSAPNPRPE
ncbi:MAG: hypothetical protein WD757_07530 [Actinomycetota bacterium]